MPESLAEVLARVMEKNGLSGYDIERRSGKEITQSYVNRIKNGDVTNPTVEKVYSLAKGTGVDPEVFFNAIKGKNGTNANFEKALQAAFHDADNWTDAEKREAIQFVRTYAEGVRSRRR
jgi:transcriptional regulator with XRE-family HTH domain